MDNRELYEQISELVSEEHKLEEGHKGAPATPEEEERLRQIEIALDQCWDLLRQRRARRVFGQDPDGASARPQEVVEGYQQ